MGGWLHSENNISSWSRSSEFELEYIGMTKNGPGLDLDLDWSLTISCNTLFLYLVHVNIGIAVGTSSIINNKEADARKGPPERVTLNAVFCGEI